MHTRNIRGNIVWANVLACCLFRVRRMPEGKQDNVGWILNLLVEHYYANRYQWRVRGSSFFD